jgi:hypothetical protein
MKKVAIANLPPGQSAPASSGAAVCSHFGLPVAHLPQNPAVWDQRGLPLEPIGNATPLFVKLRERRPKIAVTTCRTANFRTCRSARVLRRRLHPRPGFTGERKTRPAALSSHES